MSKEILKGTSKVSLLTLISRILGFIWNLLMAKIFGAGIVTDVFFVAYRIPNLLRSFLGEGALTSAFVPVFAENLHDSKEKALATLKSITGLILIITISISTLGTIFAPLIVSLIAPGYIPGTEQFDLCVKLTRITLPYIIFVSLIALINGALNNLKIYGAAPLAQITMNIVLISFAWIASFYQADFGIILLATGVIAGGILQVAVQFPSLKKAAISILPSRKLITKSTIKILKLMLPALLGAAVYQISIFINTMLASLLPTGSISWLFYADRLAQFPIGVITIALASVLLPALAQSAVAGKEKDFNKDLNNSLRYISFLIIPAATAMFILAEPTIRLLFERGNFSAYDTKQTTLAIQAMCFGLWGVSCNTTIIRAYLARQDTITPSLLGLFSLIINIILALALMGSINPSSDLSFVIAGIQNQIYLIFPEYSFQHIGLALSSGMAITLVLFLSISILKTRLNWSTMPFIKSSILCLLASLVMFFWLRFLLDFFNSDFLLLLAAIPSGALVYLVVLLIFKSKEAKETFSLSSKLFGS